MISRLLPNITWSPLAGPRRVALPRSAAQHAPLPISLHAPGGSIVASLPYVKCGQQHCPSLFLASCPWPCPPACPRLALSP
eukprot:355821-Chlamydomonas_euryale.AAC.1